MNIRKEVFTKVFRPPCFGNTVKCPVLFTEKMYSCPHHKDCEEATKISWEKKLGIHKECQIQRAARELLENILHYDDEMLSVSIMKKFNLRAEEYTEMRKLLEEKLRRAVS